MSFTIFINSGPWLSVPPPGYGGVETMLVYLIKELRRHGHRVILGTVGSSQIPVDGQVFLFEEGQHRYIAASHRDSGDLARVHMEHVLKQIEELGDIDIVHDFVEVVGPHVFARVDQQGPPVLHTLQWNLSSNGRNGYFYREFDGRGRVFFNGVSGPQMEVACDNLRRQSLGVVHNGVDVDDFMFRSEKQGYMITLARFADEKGQDVAARLCAELDIPLRMAGPVGGIGSPDLLRKEWAANSHLKNVRDVQYYTEAVLPVESLNSDIAWVGNVGGDEKRILLAGAQALLMPVRWEEPFGMAVIEALASGTPVVAMRRGAMPVIIRDGYNGFLANDEGHFKDLLRRVGEIEPENCRSSVEAWFSATEMAARYLRLYEEVIDRAQARRRRRRGNADNLARAASRFRASSSDPA